MALKLIYITKDPAVALIAEQYGVDRIMVDLETMGKEERQKGLNTVKSHHTVADVKTISGVLTSAETLVRINPWHNGSPNEIEATLAAGAQRIMLPMWKTPEEVNAFLRTVNKRVPTTLLLETKEAVDCVDTVLTHPDLDEIHIGLNDLHLSYGMTFMFEPLADGTVERLCEKFCSAGISYGFGGIARIGEGTLPAERIAMEHYRLGSSVVILSRSFCNAEQIGDLSCIAQIFRENMQKLRNTESAMKNKSPEDYKNNRTQVIHCVEQIVRSIKESRP